MGIYKQIHFWTRHMFTNNFDPRTFLLEVTKVTLYYFCINYLLSKCGRHVLLVSTTTSRKTLSRSLFNRKRVTTKVTPLNFQTL